MSRLHTKTHSNQLRQGRAFAGVSVRRQDLMNLCLCIDLDDMQLLDDTVTELLIEQRPDPTTHDPRWQELSFQKRPEAETEYWPMIDHLCVLVREDPFRVRFPTYETGAGSGFGSYERAIRDQHDRAACYGRAQGTRLWRRGYIPMYVYKEVERPLYEPRDSEALEQELRNLMMLLRGADGIVQLVAAVVSRNPYQTVRVNNGHGQTVFRGILLEYHSNGSLQGFLQTPTPTHTPKNDLPWHQWAIQMTSALSQLHEVGITHMDLKPANIVISSTGMRAILIDVSGVRGTSWDWLSPEMRASTSPDPICEDLNSRVQNDIWALGKIISAMADAAGDEAGFSPRCAFAALLNLTRPSREKSDQLTLSGSRLLFEGSPT